MSSKDPYVSMSVLHVILDTSNNGIVEGKLNKGSDLVKILHFHTLDPLENSIYVENIMIYQNN